MASPRFLSAASAMAILAAAAALLAASQLTGGTRDIPSHWWSTRGVVAPAAAVPLLALARRRELRRQTRRGSDR